MRKVYIRMLILLVILIQSPLIFCSDEEFDKLEFTNDVFYVSKEGVLKVKDKNKLPPEVIVPEKVNNKVVLDVDFSDCENLISVILPNSLTKIGNKAFFNCKNLVSIVIPDSVTVIDSYAFENCFELKRIEISNPYVVMGPWVFYRCIKLQYINIPKYTKKIGALCFCYCYNLCDVIIPESVLEIGVMSFCYCLGLKRITIPSSVLTIRDYAFSECFNLKDISYDGTKEQWEKVEKGRLWNDEVPAKVVHCTNGDVLLD